MTETTAPPDTEVESGADSVKESAEGSAEESAKESAEGSVKAPDPGGNGAAPAFGAAVALGALGVVFGDIGTSPIYALRESLRAAGETAPEATVLGVLSLVFWAVVLVVALKYVVVVMRADNDGEGGTIALMSVALPASGRWRSTMLVVGLAGVSLFFGDAMITPAISVLSAIEGTALVAPKMKDYVVPLAAGVLVALFAIQRRGSGKVGKWFGPIMLVWFATLAVAGLVHIAGHPSILAALDPRHAVGYLAHADGRVGFTVLGSVFLALTGGEALYADMGHFGRKAIRLDWFVVVMPALVLNYFGQGALVLADPEAASNPFFKMFGGHLLAPVVVLATAATVIASQAVISGAFTLVQQAIHFGVVPRLLVRHMSHESAGDVYVPEINAILAVAVLGLVLGFRSSDALAGAYGIAVAGNMLATTLLIAPVARVVWKWPIYLLVPVLGVFVALDIAFVTANAHKIPDGGWFPLCVGATLLTMMLCWRHGQRMTSRKVDRRAIALNDFIARLEAPGGAVRVPGVAIYLTQSHASVPEALSLNLAHNGIVHCDVVLLTVTTERVPRVPDEGRVAVASLGGGFRGVTMKFGFAERVDVPAMLAQHRDQLGIDASGASYFVGRRKLLPSKQPDLPWGVEHVFAFLANNAVRAPDYFLIPPEQVVELGSRMEI